MDTIIIVRTGHYYITDGLSEFSLCILDAYLLDGDSHGQEKTVPKDGCCRDQTIQGGRPSFFFAPLSAFGFNG